MGSQPADQSEAGSQAGEPQSTGGRGAAAGWVPWEALKRAAWEGARRRAEISGWLPKEESTLSFCESAETNVQH